MNWKEYVNIESSDEYGCWEITHFPEDEVVKLMFFGYDDIDEIQEIEVDYKQFQFLVDFIKKLSN